MLICVSIWDFSPPFCVKDRSQMSHLKGLSPVCILLCISQAALLRKSFPHVMHKCLDCGCEDELVKNLIFKGVLLHPLAAGLVSIIPSVIEESKISETTWAWLFKTNNDISL